MTEQLTLGGMPQGMSEREELISFCADVLAIMVQIRHRRLELKHAGNQRIGEELAHGLTLAYYKMHANLNENH